MPMSLNTRVKRHLYREELHHVSCGVHITLNQFLFSFCFHHYYFLEVDIFYGQQFLFMTGLMIQKILLLLRLITSKWCKN